MNRLFATLEVANLKGISGNLWGIKNSPDTFSHEVLLSGFLKL
jgi:hypothetical protein